MQFTDVFEKNRAHLRAVALRLLGSPHDAEDAVQQTWLKASQADLTAVANVPGWLTTVLSRECIDMLRARHRRSEVPFDEVAEWPTDTAELADGVGTALLVVLDRLSPAQRAAFVLHDLFGVPFTEIATTIGTTPAAAKKMASRARRDIHGAAVPTPSDREHLRLAEAFLAASRDGDIATLLSVLAPGVVRRVDRILVPATVATEVRGAREVAEETRAFAVRARAGAVVLIDGVPGIAIVAGGRVRILIRLSFGAGRITAVDITDGSASPRANLQLPQ
jgi:RNA polymerase sigma-70 factor (ECF subfamily)